MDLHAAPLIPSREATPAPNPAPDPGRRRPAGWGATAVLGLAALLPAMDLHAQESVAPGADVGPAAAPAGEGVGPDFPLPEWARPERGPVPVDSRGLAQGPGGLLEMLYEVTIFNIDVFRLGVAVDPVTADALRELSGESGYDAQAADSVTLRVLTAPDALVCTRFEIDIGLGRFLDGLTETLGHAREAGFLTPDQESRILDDVRVQYGPLEDRGIRDGDRMWYRIRGDSLHVVYQGRDGDILVEERAVGPERRLGVLAGYLAPGSDFREPLIRSLFGER